MIWFTNDLHFNHINLIKNSRNMSPDVHDELIIKNWNNVVSKKDKVFILGGITREKPKLAIEYLNQLRGVKEVILGNHDIDLAKYLVENKIKVNGSHEYKGYWLSYAPLHPSQVSFFFGNIHGHIHFSKEDHTKLDLGENYLNVNTEFHDYFPWFMDEIESYFNKQ